MRSEIGFLHVNKLKRDNYYNIVKKKSKKQINVVFTVTHFVLGGDITYGMISYIAGDTVSADCNCKCNLRINR